MTYSFVVEPVTVQDFESEDELIERCKEWNLLSTTATRVKTYQYKRQGMTLPCEIVGYVDNLTVVIQFQNKQRHCIHPAYLKEMQTAGFGQRASAVDAKTEDSPEAAEELVLTGNVPEEQSGTMAALEETEDAVSGETGATPGNTESAEKELPAALATPEAPAAPQNKAPAAKKKPAVRLPEDKLAVTAIIKEFTTVPNHFSDNDDEVIIYEAVSVEGHDLDIGEVWSSHSATLKKLELSEGDKVSFEAKIVAKKLTQHPVKYKINNPSKMKKLEPSS